MRISMTVDLDVKKQDLICKYLEEECNNISIMGFVENKKIIINDKVTLCKNNVLED